MSRRAVPAVRAGRASRRTPGRLLCSAAAMLLLAPPAAAWPAALSERLARDARRMVPRTLAQLLGERERLVLDEAQRFPPDLAQAVYADLAAGSLGAETLVALDAYGAAPLRLLREHRLSEGIVRLGGLLRIPADLSDPVVTAGPPALPAGVAREYYAFVLANLDKLPVTLHDAGALELPRREVPAYWRRLHEESRAQAAVLRREMVRDGRVVDHRAIDFRSPVFAVAQLSYSRAATAIAATWLATWREARGDVTRQPAPRVVRPAEGLAGRMQP